MNQNPEQPQEESDEEPDEAQNPNQQQVQMVSHMPNRRMNQGQQLWAHPGGPHYMQANQAPNMAPMANQFRQQPHYPGGPHQFNMAHHGAPIINQWPQQPMPWRMPNQVPMGNQMMNDPYGQPYIAPYFRNGQRVPSPYAAQMQNALPAPIPNQHAQTPPPCQSVTGVPSFVQHHGEPIGYLMWPSGRVYKVNHYYFEAAKKFVAPTFEPLHFRENGVAVAGKLTFADNTFLKVKYDKPPGDPNALSTEEMVEFDESNKQAPELKKTKRVNKKDVLIKDRKGMIETRKPELMELRKENERMKETYEKMIGDQEKRLSEFWEKKHDELIWSLRNQYREYKLTIQRLTADKPEMDHKVNSLKTRWKEKVQKLRDEVKDQMKLVDQYRQRNMKLLNQQVQDEAEKAGEPFGWQECEICMLPYDHKNEELTPRILRCGHTFCLACCRRFQKVKDSVVCPSDRIETMTNEIELSIILPKNLSVLSMLKISDEEKEEASPKEEVAAPIE